MRELILPGRQHWATGAHQIDNGSLTVEGLVMGGRIVGGRQDWFFGGKYFPCLRTCMREGRCLQYPSWCVCSSGCNKRREQVKKSEKKVDILLTKQKWQRVEGWFKLIKYFNNVEGEKLTLEEVLFNHWKVDMYGKNANSMEYLCKGENKLTSELRCCSLGFSFSN